MFKNIIQYYSKQGELLPSVEKELYKINQFYKRRTEHVKEKLIVLKEKYTFEKLSKIEKYAQTDCSIVFFKSPNYFQLTFELEYILNEQSYEDYDDEIHEIDKELYDREMITIDTKQDVSEIPLSLRDYYQEQFWMLQDSFFYTWIASIWQEIDGAECNIRVQIVENSSCTRFSLNDFSWDRYSNFTKLIGKLEMVHSPFNRQFTLEEIFIRAHLFPNYYHSYWRYFEKNGLFREIVIYKREIGFRFGEIENERDFPVHEIKKYESRDAANVFLLETGNKWANEGWTEKLRPFNFPEKIYPEAIETVNTGHFEFHMPCDLRLKEIEKFEKKYKLILPITYKHYLSLLNDEMYNSTPYYFPINDSELLRISKFFSLEEIKKQIEIGEKYDSIAIAKTKETKFLHININSESSEYGRIYLEHSFDEELELLDYSFETFIRYPASIID